METANKTYTIDNKTLKSLLLKTRQDITKRFCSASDACYILDVKYKKFYELLKDPDCKIRLSRIQGKYLLNSVYEEVERLSL